MALLTLSGPEALSTLNSIRGQPYVDCLSPLGSATVRRADANAVGVTMAQASLDDLAETEDHFGR
jgi:hypothetical protein